jgi:hypothetical protein
MPDLDPFLPASLNREGSPSSRAPLYRLLGYWLGLILTLVGNCLVIAALFAPWIEVFKTDPSLPLPRQGYSPWMVLQHGQVDALDVLAGALFLLTLALLITTLVLALATDARSRAASIAAILALVGLAVVGVALGGIPMALSLSYLYYEHNIAYGGGLAAVGFVSVLVGAALVGARRQ